MIQVPVFPYLIPTKQRVSPSSLFTGIEDNISTMEYQYESIGAIKRVLMIINLAINRVAH